jgi:hypothetical protein
LRGSEVEFEILNSTAAQRRLSPRQNCFWRSISIMALKLHLNVHLKYIYMHPRMRNFNAKAFVSKNTFLVGYLLAIGDFFFFHKRRDVLARIRLMKELL